MSASTASEAFGALTVADNPAELLAEIRNEIKYVKGEIEKVAGQQEKADAKLEAAEAAILGAAQPERELLQAQWERLQNRATQMAREKEQLREQLREQERLLWAEMLRRSPPALPVMPGAGTAFTNVQGVAWMKGDASEGFGPQSPEAIELLTPAHFVRLVVTVPPPADAGAADVIQRHVSESPSCLTDLRRVSKYQLGDSPVFRCFRPHCGSLALPVDQLCPIFGVFLDSLQCVEPPATFDCLAAADLLTRMPTLFESEKAREAMFETFLCGYLDRDHFIIRKQYATPHGYFIDLAVFYVEEGREHLVMIVEIRNELAECYFQGMRLYQVWG